MGLGAGKSIMSKFYLSEDNYVLVIKNALAPQEAHHIYKTRHTTKTQYGRKIFGNLPPRREVVFTWRGENWDTTKSATAQPYNARDINVAYLIRQAVEKVAPQDQWLLDNSNEVEYDKAFKRGGSIGAHADDENHWGLVTCFSLGQTRHMEFGNKGDGVRRLKVELPHNSIVAMCGETFQDLHWHRLPKLKNGVPPMFRMSFNSRWGKGYDGNETDPEDLTDEEDVDPIDLSDPEDCDHTGGYFL